MKVGIADDSIRQINKQAIKLSLTHEVDYCGTGSAIAFPSFVYIESKLRKKCQVKRLKPHENMRRRTDLISLLVVDEMVDDQT
jgi:hypothetical protein